MIRKTLDKLNRNKVFLQLKSIKKPVLIILIFIILIIPFVFFAISTNRNSFNLTNLSKDSVIIENNSTRYFNLYKSAGYIYKAKNEGLAAVWEFINKNPQYTDEEYLIPENFSKNSNLVDQKRDSEDKTLEKVNISLSNEHYYFEQKINNIPVYNSSLSFHVRNKNEIYAIDGNLVKEEKFDEQKITYLDAQKIALDIAYKEASRGSILNITKTTKYIFNKKILGLTEDTKNYLTLETRIYSKDEPVTFARKYFIDLNTGKLIYDEPLIYHVLNRQIYDCRSGSCQLSRGEGDPAISNDMVDRMYDIVGNVYSFFKDNFDRDGIDGQGSSINGKIRNPCGNASWGGNIMDICTDAFGADVIAHEMTHGVTEYNVRPGGLTYSYQSGALNESLSDVFSTNIDNNWTMGEGTGMGIIRNIDDPTRPTDRNSRYPDKLSSQYYHCDTGDHGGVHENSGVFNKAYYLMVEGSNFNSCNISGIGRSDTNKVVYRAYTYLNSSSNFKSMYTALTRACDDIFGTGSNNCKSVESALQATEMDQQPANQQQGASCDGAQPVTPVCAGGTAPTNPPTTRTPTVTRTPTSNPTAAATLTPTRRPISYSILGSVYEEADSGQKTYKSNIDVSLSGNQTGSKKTDSQGKYTFTNLVSGSYVVSIKRNGQTVPSGDIPLTSDIPSQIVDFALYPNGETQAKVTPIPAPTNTPDPTSGTSPTGTSTITSSPPDDNGDTNPGVTKTPYKCIPDPSCKPDGNNIRLCSLKCTPL